MVNEESARWPNILMRVTIACAVVALIIGGLVAVGNLARESLGPTDRYRVDFKAISVTPPPGYNQQNFLEEVQYNGQFSDDLSILDPGLADKLRQAFARHREVETVRSITILPPKRIIVELTFRDKPGPHP